MRRCLATLACLFGMSLPAVAQNSGTVVELYTSQGCSSCPPADRMLAELAARDDVIALALHVDYWDYIGWADDLARPEFTARQRDYARAWSARHVYTPQMIVAGQTSVVGSDPVKVMTALSQYDSASLPVVMEVTRDNDGLRITARATGSVPSKATVQLVTLEPHVVRDIDRGENAGKTIDYHNVVTGWTQAATWNTVDPLMMTVPLNHSGPVAVIIQDGTTGPILAAYHLP